MERQEIFFQSEGHTGAKVVEVEVEATVRDLVTEAGKQGLILHESLLLFVEGTDAEYAVAEIERRLLKDLLIGHGTKVHFHRSHHINVTVRFDAESRCQPFRPGTTIQHIKHWAVGVFGLDPHAEADHALKVCGQTVFLAENTHIGTLAHHGDEVCLVLAAKRTVNG